MELMKELTDPSKFTHCICIELAIEVKIFLEFKVGKLQVKNSLIAGFHH